MQDPSEISRKVKQLHLISRKLVDSLFAGNYHSVFKGPGLEFSDVREYVPGDDARLIDWNVSSRSSTPYIKTYKEEREMILQIVVDLSPSLNFGTGGHSKRDTAGLIFAIMAMAAVANNDKVGSLFFTDKIELQRSPMKGKKHVLSQLTEYLSFQPKGTGSNLTLALKTTSELMKRKGIVLILSDFKTAGYRKALTLLAKKHDVVAIRITDPMDSHFPFSGLLSLQDPETGEEVQVVGHSGTFRKEYADFWEIDKFGWIDNCRQCGVSPLEIDTQDEAELKLLRFFERRQK